MEEIALEARDLSKSYGGVWAVREFRLALPAGSRTAVIGPNGAGKSTLFGLLAGTIRPSSGEIRLAGADITGYPAHQRARRGLVKTFQQTRVFEECTCTENIAMMVRQRMGRGVVPFLGGGARRAVAAETERVIALTGLDGCAGKPAEQMSHGDRRVLDVAMALAVGPRVILLDEPTAGMSAAERRHTADLLTNLPRTLTSVIIEHDLDLVFSVAERVVVMASGQIIAQGTPAEVRASDAAQESYVGTSSATEVFLG